MPKIKLIDFNLHLSYTENIFLTKKIMNYTKWLDNFMNAWKNRNVDAVMKTISKNCKYYETVFENPHTTTEDIRKLWEIVPTNQRNIEFEYEIILSNDEFCIVNFLVKRTLIPSGIIQDIDGIFQISLDENGLCTFFKQWRSVKES
jgi:hypothetical protein